MRLQDLGFDDWFQEKLRGSEKPGCSVARVTAVNRDSYLVRNENGEVFAEVAGRLVFSAESSSDLPAVGDWVLVEYHNDGTLAIIHGLLPRKSMLRRKTAGEKVDYQVIASNIDVAFIIQSCDFNFNLRRLERYIVMANDGGVEPLILLSKSDLVSQEDLEHRVSKVKSAGINSEVIAFSNRTDSGLDRMRQALKPGKTHCLLGSSGVGKTTLLNHLVGRDAFDTNPVRQKDGKGRHTTARRQLIVLDNGAMLIDTPGMRELGNIGVTTGIDESFTDIRDLSKGCRFGDCTHTSEVGCSVLEALASGALGEGRYRSYLKLVKESEHYRMSYLEKRRKDREFGQLLKSAKKHNKKI